MEKFDQKIDIRSKSHYTKLYKFNNKLDVFSFSETYR